MFAKAQPLAVAGAASLLIFLVSACGESGEGADDPQPLPDIVYCSSTTDCQEPNIEVPEIEVPGEDERRKTKRRAPRDLSVRSRSVRSRAAATPRSRTRRTSQSQTSGPIRRRAAAPTGVRSVARTLPS
ncbi:hypothetical protein ACRJ4W_11995 [Streptomyces sp. GLT-R25]